MDWFGLENYLSQIGILQQDGDHVLFLCCLGATQVLLLKTDWDTVSCPCLTKIAPPSLPPFLFTKAHVHLG